MPGVSHNSDCSGVQERGVLRLRLSLFLPGATLITSRRLNEAAVGPYIFSPGLAYFCISQALRQYLSHPLGSSSYSFRQNSTRVTQGSLTFAMRIGSNPHQS